MDGKLSTRKPHSHLAGYVSERTCKAACGGHIVIYDRNKGFDCDAATRWIVMHEPSSIHVAVSNRPQAYAVMNIAQYKPDETFGVLMEDLMPEADSGEIDPFDFPDLDGQRRY